MHGGGRAVRITCALWSCFCNMLCQFACWLSGHCESSCKGHAYVLVWKSDLGIY